jgi:hypothetical protein
LLGADAPLLKRDCAAVIIHMRMKFEHPVRINEAAFAPWWQAFTSVVYPAARG